MALGHSHGDHSIDFIANKKQWHPNVLYKADIPGGSWYLEADGFTYSLVSLEDLDKAHKTEVKDPVNGYQKAKQMLIRCHALKVKFQNSSLQSFTSEGEKPYKVNYFLGNDPERWAPDAGAFEEVYYNDLYPGIDMRVYSSHASAKYDLIVSNGADYRNIQMNYSGAEKMRINNKGALVVPLSFTDFIESRPYAYQIVNGKEKEISCEYVLNEHTVSFRLGNYDKSLPLIIDPVVVASTYSGSTSTVYGHCASYDEQANVLTGGRSFGAGYPTTAGAFDLTFGGGVDIAITKLNPTGSARIYSTYIGGNLDEYVHSMHSLPNGDVLLYGSAQSTNYPVTAGCYDATHNGDFDIVVTRLSNTGTALIGSTYIGGSVSDGQNIIPYNYGDTFRGEIITDTTGEVYVASFTSSANFPVTAGSVDVTYNGGQDGVIFHLNPTLTTLTWSTFIGGSSDDAAFGLKLDKSNFGLYITGCTKSNNFPTLANALNPNFLGGGSDAFIMYLVASGNFVLGSSYLGTSAWDQSFFLDSDDANNVFVYGISEGNIPITPGCYGNAGGNQFMMKLPFALNSVILQTTFGSSSSSSFSPTAFLVDECKKIYMSGWGDVSGFPVTPNAVQSSNPGQCFYVIVLDQDAQSLAFATYFGAGGEHVDGGTSRFDKRGVIYQGVCVGNSNFPTIPGSVSPNKNPGAGWDIAVFKIDLQLIGVTAAGNVAPNDSGCVPFTVNFNNLSLSGNAMNYIWDFGDGSLADTNATPTHTYTTAGTYTVKLIAIDSLTCNIKDSVFMTVYVLPPPSDPFPQDTLLCPGNSMILDALNPGAVYSWNDASTLQTLNVSASGVYWVDIEKDGCEIRDSIQVNSLNSISLGNDITACDTAVIQLDAGVSGASYLWSTNETSQTINVTSSGIYYVDVSSSGCTLTDTIEVTLISFPAVNLGNDTTLCPGNTITLDGGNPGASYNWSTSQTSQQISVSSAGTFWLIASNGTCSSSDSIIIDYAIPLSSNNDTSLCTGQQLTLQATGSGTLLWNTGSTANSITVDTSGIFWVQSNDNGCTQTDSITVNFLALPVVSLGIDTTLCPGQDLLLSALNPGAYYNWSTGSTDSMITVSAVGMYYVTAFAGSCSASDTINISYDPELSLGSDEDLCDGETLTISAPIAGNSYLWSTGEISQDIDVTVSDQYIVTVTTNICVQTDTINVIFHALPVVDIGDDSTACEGTPITLDAGNAGMDFLWSDSTTTQTINPLISSTYIVTVTDVNGCTGTDDAIIIFLDNPDANLGADQVLCNGDVYTLNANNPGMDYLWSDGSTGPAVDVTADGTYILTVSNQFCIDTDTMTATFIAAPVFDLGADTLLCPGETLVLTVSDPGSTYLWNTGSTDSTLTVSQTGIYIITVDNGACSVSDSISVEIPVFNNIIAEESLCNGLMIQLNAPATGGTYLWSTGEVTPSIIVADSGLYWVDTDIGRCERRDTIHVTGTAGFSIVYMPNAFTPNEDGVNDMLTGQGLGLTDFSLQIYNRWGARIYASKEPGSGWDGNYEGEPAPAGVYVYHLKYITDCSKGKPIEKRGTVTVIR